jgi:hypothetical protein
VALGSGFFSKERVMKRIKKIKLIKTTTQECVVDVTHHYSYGLQDKPSEVFDWLLITAKNCSSQLSWEPEQITISLEEVE